MTREIDFNSEELAFLVCSALVAFNAARTPVCLVPAPQLPPQSIVQAEEELIHILPSFTEPTIQAITVMQAHQRTSWAYLALSQSTSCAMITPAYTAPAGGFRTVYRWCAD
jgi:hypothetical protein